MDPFRTNLAHPSSMKLPVKSARAVLGEGPAPAPMMLVGEQPGDQEDKIGRPFVGPAGRLLDDALASSEIPRAQVFVTNVIKHFHFEPRGKRRIHARPSAAQLELDAPLLEEEVRLVRPKIIVCLGATAAQFFLGRDFRITKQRGEILDGGDWAPHILATYHPSALLRMKRDPVAYDRAHRELTLDLAEAASLVRFRRSQRRVIVRGAEMPVGR